MEFFTGFKWAVPKAFTDALFQCRFEEGDILYDSENAYAEWGKARKYVNNSIQVRFPSKVVSSIVSEEKSVFFRNWDSEVRLDLFEEMLKVDPGQIHTTQGRLYTMLWKGDLEILDLRTENPEPPIMASQIKNKLTEAKKKAIEISNGSLVFVMAYDSASAVLKEKYEALASNHGTQAKLFSPKEAGFKDWERMCPTIEIAFFGAGNLQENEFREKLKKWLYKPTKKQSDSVDRFSIERHGIIFNPEF